MSTRYDYCRLEPYRSIAEPLQITSSDREAVERVIAELQRAVPGLSSHNETDKKTAVLSKHWVCYLLRNLGGKDELVFDYLLGWLCRDGWEPYAAYIAKSSYEGSVRPKVHLLRKAVSACTVPPGRPHLTRRSGCES